VAIGIIIVATACGGPSEGQRRTVDAWLNCDECINGERDSVIAMGDAAVGLLESALEGPSAERRNIMEAKFDRSYPINLGPAAVTKSQYVSRLLENYVASHQKRAALALSGIPGNRSLSALDAAIAASLTRSYREDVLRTIRLARQTSAGTPFSGTLSPVRVLFGDTVTLTAAAAQPFTLDERAVIDDGPFPADILVSRDAARLRFLAVGSAGAHVVTVTNVGSTSDAQTAAMTIGSWLDPNDRRMLGCENLTCEVAAAQPIPFVLLAPPSPPYTSFLALWRVPPRTDTLDLFRIQVTDPRSVTADLDWEGAADLDLRWLRCATLAQVGNLNGATGSKPERTTETIPAGDCRILLVTMKSGGADRAIARLRVRSL
jgi:hypothetical protein